MDRIGRMKEIREPLLSWYDRCARVLPWRSDPTPYHVLVSEIMLQQTRVNAVMEYYRRFLAELPDIRSLAEADEDRLMKLWQGLGYYSRARNLQKAARKICGELGGEFPDTEESIKKLPGVGEYTAGAIASIAFQLPVPAVDGNVLRVFSRILLDERDIMDQELRKGVRRELKEVVPEDRPGDFNQALMDLGATVCLPNGEPLCGECPVRELCLAYEAGRMQELPVHAPKKPRKIEKKTVYLIRSREGIALHKRPEKGLLAGLWELPNEPFDTEESLLSSFDTEELREGISAKHIFSHIEWHMKLKRAAAKTGALPADGEWVWAGQEELREKYALPNAFAAFEKEIEDAYKYFS